MNRFSLIVPFLGDQNAFEDTLATLLRYRPPGCEIIVAHDGTYDDRYHVAEEVTLVVSPRRAHLVRLFNCGLRAAHGEIVGLIRPGISLAENWHLAIETCLEDSRVGSVAPLIVDPRTRHRVVSAGVKRLAGFRRGNVGQGQPLARLTRDRLSALGPTSWAAFYRRSALDQVGTPDDSLDPVYMDLDLGLALQALGYRYQVAVDCVADIDRPVPLTREFETPHGRSAQRAFTRHSRDGGWGSLLQSCVRELFGSLVRPWLFQHQAQRFGARQFDRVDHAFRKRMKTRRSVLEIERREVPLLERRAA